MLPDKAGRPVCIVSAHVVSEYHPLMFQSLGLVTLCLVLLVAAVLGGLFAFYRLKFRATPEARWALAVRAVAARLEAQVRQASQEAVQAEREWHTQGRRLREQAVERYFQSISVEALADYPGIGPVTVTRLRERGLHTLAQLRKPLTVEVPGLGPKRRTDLQNAIEALLRDATSRFDSGACPEAQELRRREAALSEQYQPRITAAAERKNAAQDRLARLRPLVTVANGVTLIRFYRKEGYPGLTPELLSTPVEEHVLAPPAPAAQPMTATTPPPLPPQPAPGTVWAAEPKPAPAAIPSPPAALARSAAPGDLFRSALEQAGPVAAVATPPHPRLPQLLLMAELGYAVARCDGRVANSERDALRRHLQTAFGHEPDLLRRIDPVCEEYEKKAIDLDDCLARARALFHKHELQQLLALALTVADAAGRRNKKEEECLARVRAGLELAEPAAEPHAAAVEKTPPAAEPDTGRAPPPAPDECRVTLEIAADTPLSAELVRRQYRLLRERFDPARFASHGHEFSDVARRKREAVEAAARTLLAAMNEPLEVEAAPPKPKDLRDNPDLDAIFG